MVIVYTIIEESYNKNGIPIDNDWILQNIIPNKELETAKYIDPASLTWGKKPCTQILTVRTFIEASKILHDIAVELTHINLHVYKQRDFRIFPIIIAVAEEVLCGPSADNTPNKGINSISSENLYGIIKDICEERMYGTPLTRWQYKHSIPKLYRKSKKLIFDYWCNKLKFEYKVLPLCYENDNGSKLDLLMKDIQTNKLRTYKFNKRSAMYSSPTVVPERTDISTPNYK